MAPKGLPKADFLRWMGDRIYLNTHFNEKHKIDHLIDQKLCTYDPRKKQWFLSSCYKEDGLLLAQLNRRGSKGFWLEARYRK